MSESTIELNGFTILREQVSKQLETQKQLFVKIVNHGLVTGQLIMEYAAQPELRAAVDLINKTRRESGQGGRDVSYHCHVAALLEKSGVGVSKAWLEKCARAYERSKEMGFTVKNVNQLSCANGADTTDFETALQDALPSLERVFPPAKTEPAPAKKLTFKDFLSGLVRNLDSMHEKVGDVGLKRKPNQEAISDALEDWFQSHGIEVEITFKA